MALGALGRRGSVTGWGWHGLMITFSAFRNNIISSAMHTLCNPLQQALLALEQAKQSRPALLDPDPPQGGPALHLVRPAERPRTGLSFPGSRKPAPPVGLARRLRVAAR